MDSMSALGVEVKDLNYYMDILSNAQNRSNTTASDLMEAYIACGGTLKDLGVSLEESSTLLGVMANRGVKASESGNALNSILINLTKKGGESADALEQMGISAFDAEGNFKGITPVLQEVNNAFANMTEEQKTNYASMIAGKTQITGFRALLSGLSQEYGTLYNAQQNATGALEEMYNVMNNNTQGKIEALILGAV